MGVCVCVQVCNACVYVCECMCMYMYAYMCGGVHVCIDCMYLYSIPMSFYCIDSALEHINL